VLEAEELTCAEISLS